MPLTAPNLKTELFLNDARTSLFIEDETAIYSSDNLLGYGVPTVTIASISTVTITVNYTLLSYTLIYEFGVTSGNITSATLSKDNGVTTIDILSQLINTSWPFTSINRFELNKNYGYVIPTLDDMVYEVDYRIQGNYLANVFDYTTSTQELVDTAISCCMSKKLTKVDINDEDSYKKVLLVNGYLLTAYNANKDLNTDKSNSYLILAKSLCDDVECGC